MAQQAEKDYQLKVAVKGFEGKFAILETEDNRVIQWPIKNLPDEVEQGSQVRLKASTSLTEDEEREKLAQAVINKILRE